MTFFFIKPQTQVLVYSVRNLFDTPKQNNAQFRKWRTSDTWFHIWNKTKDSPVQSLDINFTYMIDPEPHSLNLLGEGSVYIF